MFQTSAEFFKGKNMNRDASIYPKVYVLMTLKIYNYPFQVGLT
jgi:hypothetical protein